MKLHLIDSHFRVELETVQDHLGKEEMTREEVAKELQAVREDYQNEMLALNHARKIGVSFSRKLSKVFTQDKEKKNAAASVIQHSWRKKRAATKQEKYQRENDEAIVKVQSALKAHLTRQRVLSLSAPPHDSVKESVEEVESLDSDEAIETIQSAMRGYFTRQMVLQDLQHSRFV
jgi:uncharacterized protein (DUF3084 family)